MVENTRIRLQRAGASSCGVPGACSLLVLLTWVVSVNMVNFRQESEVYWNEWAALRADQEIVENPLS